MTKNEVKKPTDSEIRTWVSNDLSSAVTCLNMIRNDPEMMKAISDIIITRIRTEEENKAAQPELELNEVE